MGETCGWWILIDLDTSVHKWKRIVVGDAMWYICYLSTDTGTDCETFLFTDTTVCASNPCLNGGGCVGDSMSYTCNCRSAFTGTSCETLLSK